MNNREREAQELYDKGLVDEGALNDAGFQLGSDGTVVEMSTDYVFDKKDILGHEIEKNGKRLAFLSNKSNTIHIAQPVDGGPKTSGFSSYAWSACNNGGKRHEELYIHPSEVGDEYIIRNGEVVGKLCGNCSSGYKDRSEL